MKKNILLLFVFILFSSTFFAKDNKMAVENSKNVKKTKVSKKGKNYVDMKKVNLQGDHWKAKLNAHSEFLRAEKEMKRILNVISEKYKKIQHFSRDCRNHKKRGKNMLQLNLD